jgi:hypothetical protein
MERVRISLAGLMLLTTAVAAFFGFSQWRRQHIINTCAQFRGEGVEIHAPNAWRDSLWQDVPRPQKCSHHD